MQISPLHASRQPGSPLAPAELDPAASAAPLARTEDDASLFPEDLRVVSEGASTWRAAALAGGVLLAGSIAYGAWNNTILMPAPGERSAWALTIGACCAALAATLYPRLARYRRDVRLTDEGIESRVTYGRAKRPWLTRIAWTDIAEYRASNWDDAVRLDVLSGRGVQITLEEVPPRRSTRELIRRFEARAGRHPRIQLTAGVPLGNESNRRYPRLLAASAVALVALEGVVDVPVPTWMRLAGLGTLGLLAGGFALWLQLGDSDVAHADRTAGTFGARLRNRVRRLFGIRHL